MNELVLCRVWILSLLLAGCLLGPFLTFIFFCWSQSYKFEVQRLRKCLHNAHTEINQLERALIRHREPTTLAELRKVTKSE